MWSAHQDESKPNDDDEHRRRAAQSRQAHLEQLPPDALNTIARALRLVDLDALAHATSAPLDDALWRPHLGQRLAAVEARLAATSRSLSSQPPHHKLDASWLGPPPQDDADADALRRLSEWARAARLVLEAPEAPIGCRAALDQLRAVACELCGERPCDAAFFAATRRGICTACDRDPGVSAHAWRQRQQQAEEERREQADDAVRLVLERLLAPSLRVAAAARGGPHAARDTLQLRFCSERHGNSLRALLRRVEGCAPSVVLLREAGSDARAFGVLFSGEWSSRGVSGDERTVLFSLQPNFSPRRSSGGAAGALVHADGTGLGLGGDRHGGFALHISEDLARGRSLPVQSFGDTSQLASGVDFVVSSVQCWEWVEGSPHLSCNLCSSRAQSSVLEPGPNRLMLEFVRVDKELAMLRRDRT